MASSAMGTAEGIVARPPPPPPPSLREASCSQQPESSQAGLFHNAPIRIASPSNLPLQSCPGRDSTLREGFGTELLQNENRLTWRASRGSMSNATPLQAAAFPNHVPKSSFFPQRNPKPVPDELGIELGGSRANSRKPFGVKIDGLA